MTEWSSETSAFIESNSGVMLAKPVIRVTRVTVELILEKLSAGATIEELLRAHPRLTRQALLAAIESDEKGAAGIDGN
jgi:uncharacterized protein (DUF433 family)